MQNDEREIEQVESEIRYLGDEIVVAETRSMIRGVFFDIPVYAESYIEQYVWHFGCIEFYTLYPDRWAKYRQLKR